MIGIDESVNFDSDEQQFDAPTRLMKTARPRHNLYVVTPRTVRRAEIVVPAKRTPAVTILDRTVIAPERCSIAAVDPVVPQTRIRLAEISCEVTNAEAGEYASGFSGAGLIVAGICGLVVGLLWGRRSG